jgi:hypothetical protein
MAFNANFTGLTVGTDPVTEIRTLFVNGTSRPASASHEIHVLMRHNDAPPVVAAVDEATKTAWQARFPEDAHTPFEPGDEILVAGVATLTQGRPFVWNDLLTIH